MLPLAVLFEVLTVALQTPQESPSTLQRYEKMPKVQSTGRPINKKQVVLSYVSGAYCGKTAIKRTQTIACFQFVVCEFSSNSTTLQQLPLFHLLQILS